MRAPIFLLFLMLWIGFYADAIAAPGFAPTVDLHAHLRGILSGRELLELGFAENNLSLRLADLEAARVPVRAGSVIGSGEGARVPLKPANFPDRAALERALSLSPDRPGTFRDLEIAYDLRRSLSAFDPAHFYHHARVLERIAENYRRAGVQYAEITAPAEMLKPVWEEKMGPVLERIEATRGVRLRFLLGIRRDAPAPERAATVTEVKRAALRNPYLVGADFLGEEVNPTHAFADSIAELARLRRRRPCFQVRVHAGENPRFPANIREAIAAGATRIGHGVYGADAVTLALARERNVIVEINGASNLALGNIARAADLPALRYARAGVRITVGTDGAGIFTTDPRAEGARLAVAGLGPAEFARMQVSDETYKKEAAEAEVRFRRSLVKSSGPCPEAFARFAVP